jgi:hypothetical protein
MLQFLCTLSPTNQSFGMKTLLSLNVICLFLFSCGHTATYSGKVTIDKPWGTSVAELKNGVREGSMVNYFPNGMTRDSETYSSDKVNGRVFHYDSLGVLESEEYAYFGVTVGPRILYQQGKVSTYSFVDFNRTMLVECKYDTGGRCRSVSTFDANPVMTNAWLRDRPVKELSLYLPRPPRFTITHKLGISYSGDKADELTEIKSNNVYWDTILPVLPPGRNYYVSSHLYDKNDSINQLLTVDLMDSGTIKKWKIYNF